MPEIQRWSVQFASPDAELTSLAKYLVGATSGIPHAPKAAVGEIVGHAMKFVYGGIPISAHLTIEYDAVVIETKAEFFRSYMIGKADAHIRIPRHEIQSVDAPPSILGYAFTFTGTPAITIKMASTEVRIYAAFRTKTVLAALRALIG